MATLPVTEKLSELLRMSSSLCRGRGVDVSYTSLLAVMTVSSDPFSMIFGDLSAAALQEILRQGDFVQSEIEKLRDPANLSPLQTDISFGDNFRQIWYHAQNFARDIGRRSNTDVHDVLAAYLVDRESVNRLFKLGIDVVKCRRGFLDRIRNERLDELRAWELLLSGVSLGNLPKHLVVAQPIQPSTKDEPGPVTQIATEDEKGPSTHVARDRWTTDDTLEYFPYANAIACFLTNSQTASPLTISIQAPWGGGKTSLMRMIQALLDPHHPGLKEGLALHFDSPANLGTSVGEINNELNGQRFVQPKIESDPRKQNGRLTVWFNAWKYESTNQIWAGLADAIVTQIADRLPSSQRELFYFQLHLKRLDVSKVRARITNDLIGYLYSNFVRAAWIYLLVPSLGFAIHLFFTKPQVPFSWKSLSAIADLVLAFIQSFKAKFDFDKKPARITLGDLVAAPNYDSNLGFVHHVTQDLRRALELVPLNQPLVIFIDDLDRCSPNKVADVVEAVNLFLAGEFENCMFVLGIDAEIVAAALDKSHGDVFAQMPSYARTTSVGWRFMDKFVQLPFILPPPDQAQMARYAKSLLVTSHQGGRVSFSALEQVADSIQREHDHNTPVREIVCQVQQELNLDDTERDQLLIDAATIKKMDDNIRSFTDNEELIANRIMSSVASYSRNPRDVKRFVNSFRFYYFLRSARYARNQPVPSLDQLSRWIVLSLRWPGIVRWLRGRGLVSDESAVRDLALLENAAQESSKLSEWVDAAGEAMRLTDREKAWLSDEDILSFFATEATLSGAERLSSSIGKGLW